MSRTRRGGFQTRPHVLISPAAPVIPAHAGASADGTSIQNPQNSRHSRGRGKPESTKHTFQPHPRENRRFNERITSIQNQQSTPFTSSRRKPALQQTEPPSGTAVQRRTPRKYCDRESVRGAMQRSPSRSVRGRERAKPRGPTTEQGMPRCGRDAALPPPHPFHHTGRRGLQTRPLISVLYACFPSTAKPHLETQPSRLGNLSQPNQQTKQPKMWPDRPPPTNPPRTPQKHRTPKPPPHTTKTSPQHRR